MCVDYCTAWRFGDRGNTLEICFQLVSLSKPGTAASEQVWRMAPWNEELIVLVTLDYTNAGMLGSVGQF